MDKPTTYRLYVNGRFLTQKQTGVQRFASQVVYTLNALLDEPGYDYLRGCVTLVTPTGVAAPGRLTNLKQVSSGLLGRGYAWEQLDLVRLSAAGVLLNLCNLAPLAKRRQVVVMHDASPSAVPQSFSTAFRLAYSVLIPAIARRSIELATVSEFSRGEISRWVRVSESRISVCHEGGEHILSQPANRSVMCQNGLSGKRYFLAVGMGPANKSQDLLLKAFARTRLHDVQLVLTGRRNAKVHGSAVLEVPPGVVHVGHVSDGELRALYEGALALVYPSTYEGFGLPPLEAMACGCPVVLSNQPALIELANDAGLAVRMGDTEGFVEAMCQIAENPELRLHLSRLGLQRAQRFTWRATTERLLERCKAAAERGS